MNPAAVMIGADMAIERGRYCTRCRARVLARERQFNVWGHAGLCLLTCGIWLPFALVLAVLHGVGAGVFGGYLCSRCGSRLR